VILISSTNGQPLSPLVPQRFATNIISLSLSLTLESISLASTIDGKYLGRTESTQLEVPIDVMRLDLDGNLDQF